jgi:hypothetical protein
MIKDIVGLLLAPVLGIKKPKYCLWLWNPQSLIWECQNPKGSSARRCKKAKKATVRIGYPSSYLEIFPLGFSPSKLIGGQNAAKKT